MYNGSKETLCSHCEHLQVCSLKAEFIAAQQAVDNVCVNLGDRKMKNLRDFDWIKAVNLECVHFISKRSTIRGALSDNQARGIALCATEGKFMEDPT